MNSIEFNNNYRANYINQNYNPSQTENLMKYVNNINRTNQNYTREKEITQMDNDNLNEFEKEKNNLPKEEIIIPERSLSNYINNKFLSDAILKYNDTEFYFHKIVLCSCSDYINNKLTSNSEPKEGEGEKEEKEKNESKSDNKNKTIIKIPEIIPSSFGGGNRTNCVEKILKYCYNNQDFKCIESDITQYNIFTLLELANCLGINSLKLNIENKIIKNYLDKDNATKLALESKIFDLKKLYKECINFLIKNFRYVKYFKNDILDLDYETFKKIISSDTINVDNEKDISDFVIDYIKSRRSIPEEKKEEEKKEEEKNEEKKEEEKKEEKKEEEKKEEEKKEEEKKEGKENKENDVDEKWKNYLNEFKEKIKRKKLSKEQEKELILCIRFNSLSHTELVRLTNEPIMDEYKDLLLKALSMKLNSYEETPTSDDNLFNMNPRICLQNQVNENINVNENDFNNPNQNDNNYYYTRNNIREKESFNYKSMPNKNYSSFPKNFNNNLYNEENPNNNNNRDFYKSDYYNNNDYYRYNKKSNNNVYRNDYIKENNDYDEDYHNINNNNDDNDSEDLDIDKNKNYEDRDNLFNKKQKPVLNSQFFNINNKNEKEKINRYRQMIKSEDNKSPNKFDQSSLSSNINNQIIPPANYNIKFKYKNDFDKNGALYFIGTYGLTRKYQNPHDLKLVKAFGSSLLSGFYEDFVGRNLVNLCSENEENSFFGVDLGPNRTLLPTLYSIKNRDSSSNVLLSWSFQGSNDKVNYVVLDRRMFNDENDAKNRDRLRRYRNLLKEPKTTSTWGVSKKIREKYPNGFRYFILKQIGKNSSGNFNLAISGFELYGDAIGNGWIFY